MGFKLGCQLGECLFPVCSACFGLNRRYRENKLPRRHGRSASFGPDLPISTGQVAFPGENVCLYSSCMNNINGLPRPGTVCPTSPKSWNHPDEVQKPAASEREERVKGCSSLSSHSFPSRASVCIPPVIYSRSAPLHCDAGAHGDR